MIFFTVGRLFFYSILSVSAPFSRNRHSITTDYYSTSTTTVFVQPYFSLKLCPLRTKTRGLTKIGIKINKKKRSIQLTNQISRLLCEECAAQHLRQPQKSQTRVFCVLAAWYWYDSHGLLAFSVAGVFVALLCRRSKLATSRFSHKRNTNRFHLTTSKSICC